MGISIIFEHSVQSIVKEDAVIYDVGSEAVNIEGLEDEEKVVVTVMIVVKDTMLKANAAGEDQQQSLMFVTIFSLLIISTCFGVSVCFGFSPESKSCSRVLCMSHASVQRKIDSGCVFFSNRHFLVLDGFSWVKGCTAIKELEVFDPC